MLNDNSRDVLVLIRLYVLSVTSATLVFCHFVTLEFLKELPVCVSRNLMTVLAVSANLYFALSVLTTKWSEKSSKQVAKQCALHPANALPWARQKKEWSE
jgi:hypothetical protein